MLILRAPQDSQPQEAVGVDWENPLTRKLVFLGVGGQENNLVTNAAPTYNGGVVTRTVTPKGIANETATGGANRRDYGNLPLPADGLMTHGAVFIPRSNAVFSYLINRGFGVPGNELLWLNDTDKKIRFSFGNTGVFIGATSATLDEVNIATGSVPANGLTASNTVVYLNGVRQANFGGSTDATSRNTSSTLIVAGRSSDTTRQFAGGLLLTASWDRLLTENEHLSFHANPWQLFAPRSIWVPVSVGGGVGRLYYVIGPSAGWSTPTAAEIMAGQLSGGSPATASGNEISPTVTTDPFTFSADATGLTPGTNYRVAYVWSDE